MNVPLAAPTRLLASADPAGLQRSLAGQGLRLNLGLAQVQVRGDAPDLGRQLQQVYGRFPVDEGPGWADIHLRIDRVGGLRRLLRPQVALHAEGQFPFDPFPATHALPLLEWGCNWMIGRCCNWALLLHAGALERDGLALVLPATPGSGKSTLTAALSHRGWRLLSDEFGAYDPQGGVFHAVLKPVALKNESIDVIRRFSPSAVFGPVFPNTRKGTVAHMAATPDAVARRHETARPGAVVLPRWQAGSPTRWEPVPAHLLFPALAFNAFNYGLLGAVGFRAAVALVQQCPAWRLTYSDLDEAMATLQAMWPAVVQKHRAAP